MERVWFLQCKVGGMQRLFYGKVVFGTPVIFLPELNDIR